jgi:hydroxyacylglutathione hydrolase
MQPSSSPPAERYEPSRSVKITPLKVGLTNSYLLQAGHQNVLIDTGYEDEWERFHNSLQEVNVRLSDISHLVLTHSHDDHCGLLNRVVQANPDMRIVMSSHARELLAKGANDRTHGGAYINRRVKLILSSLRRLNKRFDERWSTHRFPPYRARAHDILIREDTQLDAIGIGLHGRILETPGHSIDSISVVLEDGSCFVGDAASNMPHIVGTHYCVIQLEDLEEYYKSWGKLLAAGARRIFPAHGQPFSATELERNVGKITSSDIIAFA